MGKIDFYNVLGVTKASSQKDIKSAYKKLAIKKHPDKFSDPDEKIVAEEEFKSITEAYNVLSDPNKRRVYDRPQRRIISNPSFGGFNGTINVVFESRPLELVINISADEAYKGLSKQVEYARHVMCNACMGSGAGTKELSVQCPSCGGSQSFGGFFVCGRCKGLGKIVARGCEKCLGVGSVQQTTNTSIDIPSGCSHAHVIRKIGCGNFSKVNKSSGDLYVRVAIVSDDVYNIDFPHLIVNVPITYETAVLGGNIVVPSPHGKVNITIPPGISHGAKLRVSGKGLRVSPPSPMFGYLIVSIEIEIPQVVDGGEKLVKSLKSDLLVHKKVRAYEQRMGIFED